MSAVAALLGSNIFISAGRSSAAEAGVVVVAFPAEDEVIGAGPFTIRGSIGVSAGNAQLTVLYVVDVSGSTSASGSDCNGDGKVDSADDLNQDGEIGEILDCEIAGVIALNTQLGAIAGADQNVFVGLVPFGNSALIADVRNNTGQQDYVRPFEDQGGRDRTADIVQAVASLNQGTVGLFTPGAVGTGTDFDQPLALALDRLNNFSGRKVVFLLSDGAGSLSQRTIERLSSSDIDVRPFAIGAGSDRCNGTLKSIADASGTTCVYAPSPSTLTAVIDQGAGEIRSVTVRVDSSTTTTAAAVDALANFRADVAVIPGPHSIEVTVTKTDGSVSSLTRRFRAEQLLRFVALGDSYSAGEGITPFVPLPGPKEGCHQSTKGYPRLVGAPSYELPPAATAKLKLDYVACSGAVLRNILSTPQEARGETNPPQIDRVDPSADLVTVTIGGNDWGFSEVGSHCATQAHCYDEGYARLTSGKTLTVDQFLRARLALLRPEIQALYSVIRSRTNNTATIVALSYPEPFNDGRVLRFGCKEGLIFGKSEREWLNAQARSLADALDESARRSGIWFASVVDGFNGHRICEGGVNDNDEWIVGHETTAKKVAGDASFHPTDKGAKYYAKAVTTLLRDKAANGAVSVRGLPLNPSPALPAASPLNRAELSGDNASNDLAGYTPEELNEIASYSFSQSGIASLGELRGDDRCVSPAVPSEELVFTAYGFRPGAAVAITLDASTEGAERTSVATAPAGDDGVLRTSILLPADIAPDPRPDGTTALRVSASGDGENESSNRASTVFYFDPKSSPCSDLLRVNGDLVDESGRAPSAPNTPGVPTSSISFGSRGQTALSVVPFAVESTLEGGSVVVTVEATGQPTSFVFDCDSDGAPEFRSDGPTATCPAPQDGTLRVTASALDASGEQASDWVEIAVDNVAPVVSLRVSGVREVGRSVLLEATSNDPSPIDSAALAISFDLDGNGTFEPTAGGQTAQLKLVETGTQTVAVRVCDNRTCTDASESIVVVAAVAPQNELPRTGPATVFIIMFATAAFFVGLWILALNERRRARTGGRR
jgi:GDSL-like Lipase/Acylhydrolase family